MSIPSGLILLVFLLILKVIIKSDELVRIANALERIADFYEKGLHVDIDHAHIDDIGEIHGDVVTHPKQF